MTDETLPQQPSQSGLPAAPAPSDNGTTASAPDPASDASSQPATPASPAAPSLAQRRERAACLAENTDPASPLYPVYLADYFGASPNVISYYPDRFRDRFMWECYQDALDRERNGMQMTPWQSKVLGKADQAPTVASGTATPQSTPPFAGGSGPNTPIKEIKRERDNLIRNFGYSMLAKHYGVKTEDVAAMPDFYWQQYASEPADSFFNTLPGTPDGATDSARFSTGMDAQKKALAKLDPLSSDGEMRKLILGNRALFSNGMLDSPENRKPDTLLLAHDSQPRGKANTSVFVFDSPTRPEDKGVPGTSYGGIAYTVITTPDGKQIVHGPYRISTFSNSKSATDNTPKWAEIKGKTLSEGGDDYNNEWGHKYNKADATQGLLMGTYKYNDKGKVYLDPNVESTGPNPVNNGERRVNSGEIHHGASDLGNFKSRGSKACFTVHPDDVDDFFDDNFNWNDSNPNTGTSRGKVYTYRVDSAESIALKHWLESQHPTR